LGIVRLDESLVDLVRSGRVTRETALTFAEAPEELDAVLSGKRQAPPPPLEPKRPDAAGLIGKAGQIFGKRGA
jgi:twitching motility protein PilT